MTLCLYSGTRRKACAVNRIANTLSLSSMAFLLRLARLNFKASSRKDWYFSLISIICFEQESGFFSSSAVKPT